MQSLVDACHAAALLRGRGAGVTLTILTSAPYLERYRAALAIAPNISVGEASPNDEEFIRRIRSASVLLLPVNFDRRSVEFIRYSLPTKVPAYLASGTPILAYGPPDVAQIEYARDECWAHIVNERNVAGLSEAMERLVGDEALRRRLSARATALARQRHDLSGVRDQFQSAVASRT